MSAAFQHGLFGCFDNCGVCIITYFVPCYTQGRVAEKVGESCLVCGLIQLVPIANIIFGAQIRGKVRSQKNIPGSFLMDLLTFWCCYCCSIVQEAQEVNAMGSQSMARE
jgi:Cys-rich protein (TIGR01571 family)